MAKAKKKLSLPIQPPIAIIGRGRCGTSALAGALRAGGWTWPDLDEKQKEPKIIAMSRHWVPGYLSATKQVKEGNHKPASHLEWLRGDETIVWMTRQIDEHVKAVIHGLDNTLTEDEARKSIEEFNEQAKKIAHIEIDFTKLLDSPREVLSLFDVDLEKAVEFIRPTISNFHASDKK